ncbi:hypothetical protein QL285_002966 [Trifolium repens]|jgi:hypothetical protein|nr:hypothetical protein QL285_002966 [Trifolium repens]
MNVGSIVLRSDVREEFYVMELSKWISLNLSWDLGRVCGLRASINREQHGVYTSALINLGESNASALIGLICVLRLGLFGRSQMMIGCN